LFLLVTATGSKLWRFKYRFDGREKLLSFGSFPDVPLRVARDKRDEARRTLSAAEPMDPSAKRQAERAARADTFGLIAEEWLTPPTDRCRSYMNGTNT
jgi:Arm DNA-binding domain